MRLSLIVVGLAWAATAEAAPAADLVVFHAPSDADPSVTAARDACAAVARRRGAAWIDTTPAPPVPPETAQVVRQAQRDYDQLQFDTAIGALDRAAAEVDRTGGAGLDPTALSDLFLYRGLARVQTGDARAWDDLVEAAALAPARVLDPARFPPRAIETYARAADAARAAPRATVVVRAPDGCAVAIDGGEATAARAAVVAGGRHFVAVRCPGARPWGGVVTAASGEVTVDAHPEAEAAPTDDELEIQARTAGATAVIAIEVAGAPPIAVLRRLSADGRPLDRASVALGGGRAGGDAAAALDRLLAPPVVAAPPEHWYSRRWVWAAAGAGVVAAVLIPVLILDDGGQARATVTLDPQGLPW